MGFTSVDNFVAEISSEKIFRSDWQYRTSVAMGVAGFSTGIDLSTQPGQFGPINQFPGTALAWRTCDDSTGNGTQRFGIPHGGNVSPDTKHIISASSIQPSGPPTIGGCLVLVDLQGYWPGISHATTTTQTLTGTPSLRYPNGDGCRLYTVCTSATGATAQNIRINYVNQASATSNTGLFATRVSSVVGQMNTSSAGSTQSLYFPLVGNDTGIQNVVDVTFSAASTGTSALCLARPLLSIPLTTQVGYITEREYLYQTPSLPRIYDGACLTWLFFSPAGVVATATGFVGHIECAWS